MLEKIKFWFNASRGYSLPMSVFSWLIIFCWGIKINGNIIYGIIALVGIALTHLGTNLFDDYIDFKNNIPKQDCKRVYFKNEKVSLNKIFFILAGCFGIAFFIGIFFVSKFGINIILITVLTGILCLLYPKLNHYALGELALITIFGPCIFYGVSVVMEIEFKSILFIISMLVGILTVILLDAHALMDFDSDKKSNKKTLLVILGNKKYALNFLFFLIFLSYGIMFFLILKGIISPIALLIIFTLPITKNLYFYLREYIKQENSKDFLRNFILARNLVITLEIILTISICIK